MQRNYPYLISSWLTVLFPVWIVMGNAPPDIAMSTIAVLFLVHSYQSKNWRWCGEPWVKCMGLLWGYMIVRGAIADYDYHATEALRRALPFGRYFVFAAALAYWTLQENDNRQRFFKTVTIVTLILAADCLLQWAAGFDIIGRPSLRDPAGHLRLTGPFRSPMPGIILAWLYFPAFLSLIDNPCRNYEGREFLERVLVRDPQVMRRLMFAQLPFMLVLPAIALTGERMALFFTIAGWIMVSLLLRRAVIFAGFIVVILASILMMELLGGAGPEVLNRQVISTITVLKDWHHSPYGMLLDTDLKLAAQHPIFGAGTNYFRVNCPKLYPGYDAKSLAGVCNIHPHNIYMEWLIDEGIIGLGLFIAFIGFVLLKCARVGPWVRPNAYFIALLVTFLMRIWPFASSTNFTSPFGAPPFWLVVGALMFYAAGAEESAEAPPASRS